LIVSSDALADVIAEFFINDDPPEFDVVQLFFIAVEDVPVTQLSRNVFLTLGARLVVAGPDCLARRLLSSGLHLGQCVNTRHAMRSPLFH
jgi:hypothetical protein